MEQQKASLFNPQAPLLAFDTSSENCAVALWHPEKGVLAQWDKVMYRGHADRLHGIVATLMDTANLGFEALGGVVTTRGPGSFTGVRIGLAAALGYQFACGLPALALPSSYVIGKAALARYQRPVTVWLEAHGNDVYTQVVTPETDALEAPIVTTVDVALKALHAQGTEALLCGNGMLEQRERLPEGLACPALESPAHFRYVGAAQLAALGHALLLAGQEASAPLTPLYLRPLQYRTIAERQALAAASETKD